MFNRKCFVNPTSLFPEGNLPNRHCWVSINKFIFELEDVLEQKNVSLIVSDNARKWFAENGYDSNMGARPMFRLIEKEIRKPLADELLFGKLSNGGTVKVGIKKDRVTLNIS